MTNEQVMHNFHFVDPDGDSLNYSLVEFSSNSVNKSSRIIHLFRGIVVLDNIEINESNGRLVLMSRIRRVYSTMKSDEYRGGVLLGSVYFETFLYHYCRSCN